MIVAISMPEIVQLNHEGAMEKQPRIQRLAFLVPMIFMLLGFSTALACILWTPQEKSVAPRGTNSWAPNGRGSHFKRELRNKSVKVPANLGLGLFYILFLNPLIAFIIQIILAVLSVILVLSQKFSVPEELGKWCGLQDEGENAWGFGQTLSVVMLLLPAMSAAQAYLEGRQHIQEGRKGSGSL